MSIYPEKSIILAPLSGFTDMPFRESARRFGCEYAFTEMIDAGSLLFGNEKTLRFLDRGKNESWLGTQLVGACPDTLKKAVEILNEKDFSVIDFNLGCPAPKMAKKCEGAALALKPDNALKAFDAVRTTARGPVTAKIRILDERDPKPTIDLALRLQDAGADAVAVHGRVMKMFYSGPVFFDIIKAVRESLKIQVIANGGVMGLPSYREIMEKTGCSCVMLARGAVGNPWLFTELSQPDSYLPPSAVDLSEEMEKHIYAMIEHYGEDLAMKISRKVVLAYLKGRGFPGELKSGVSFMNSKEDFDALISQIAKGPSFRYWSCLKGKAYKDREISR